MSPVKPLRVLVDLTWLLPGGEGGGIKPALLCMLRWLGVHGAGRLEFVYLADATTYPEILELAGTAECVISAAADRVDLAARHRCDVVYCPFGITDYACPGIPTITLAVDLLHRDFPETLSESDRVHREQIFRRAVVVSDLFQVISDYTGARLQECYAVPASRIFRTHLPVHDRLTVSGITQESAAGAGRPFFFYPANTWIHKNHETLLVAYAMYRHAVASPPWALVLTGHEDARLQDLKRIARSLEIEADVTFAGYVSADHLARYYCTAGALVFPSLHEGFGLPLIEAMAFGAPILASNATAIPEITGRAALLVDARQPALLAAAMQRMATDAKLRTSVVADGRIQLNSFLPEIEFGRLFDTLISMAQTRSVWRHSGYHIADGWTDPVAVFGLPRTINEITLEIKFRPMPALRTVQISCGCLLLADHVIPAARHDRLIVKFIPQSRALTLRVSDASSLSATDPRTHGVWLSSLRVRSVDGTDHDLLAGEAP
jgi:glycosyltransferase involved in cell wall biosynthesis